MGAYVESPTRTFEAGAAIAQFLRVKISSGQVVVCAGADVGVGTIERETFAAGEDAPVRLHTAQGSRKMVAAGAFAEGATIYGAAGGKVDDAVVGNPSGVALEAAGADGDIVECLWFPYPA